MVTPPLKPAWREDSNTALVNEDYTGERREHAYKTPTPYFSWRIRMLRRSPVLLAVALMLLLPIAGKRPSSAQAKPTDKKKPSVTAQAQGGAPRIPIPGVGGSAPRRKKPLPQSATPVQVPLTGPTLPLDTGKFPAPVLAPGQYPGVPGLPGLQSRLVNPLLFGVNLSVDAFGIADKGFAMRQKRLAELMKAAGVSNVRITARWGEIERTRNKYDWQPMDRAVKFASDQDFAIVSVVDSSPAWTGQAGMPGAVFTRDIERFAGALGARYKGRINLWEFWNEPNSTPESVGIPGTARPAPPRASTYALLMQAFSRGIKRASPAVQVAIGGLAAQDTRFLSELYQLGGRASFDAVALHPSSPRDVVNFEWIDAIRALMIRNGDTSKPLWITDWGWSTATGRADAVSELHQARLIRQSLAGMRDRPFIVEAAYRSFNDWRQKANDPTSLVMSGLSSYALLPKPGYAAFREMATGINPEAVARYARVPLVGALPLAEEAGVRGSAVQVVVDADKPSGPLPRVWEGVSQGYEPGLAALPSEIASPLKALGMKLVRFDPFPNPDWVQPDRIVVSDSVDGNGGGNAPGSKPLSIRWQYADSMMDVVEQAGANAMLNFATMPTALSSPGGNPRMPRDMKAWTIFVREVARRYNAGKKHGVAYWELSSEPNRGDYSLDEWLVLYAAFARAVVAEDPAARVGGPAVSGFDESWLRGVADRCNRDHIPLHFLSWHAYGQPAADYARQVESMQQWLQQFKELKSAELIVSEWNMNARPSPENDSLAAASHAASVIESLLNAAPNRALYYTLREGPDPRKTGERLTGRWGLLTHNNQPKAAYNVFRLLNRMGESRIPASSEETDIHALASRSPDHITVILWSDPANMAALDYHGAQDLPVFVRVRGLPWRAGTQGEQWTIDALHGNIAERPERMGVEQAARFSASPGDVEIPVVVSPNSVTLLELRPGKPSRIELSLESPRYVVYGSSRVALTARVRNAGALPQQVSLNLAGRDFGEMKAKHAAVTVGPGETKIVPFVAPVAGERAEGQRFFTVTTPTGEAASTSVKLASPLLARLQKSRIDIAPPARPAALSANAIKPMARFQLVLDNRSDTLVKVGVAGGLTSLSVAVPGGRATTVPVLVLAPSSAPGVYSTPVRIIQNGSIIRTLTASVGTLAASRFAARMPNINADLSEWMDAEKLTLEPALRDRRGSLTSLNGQVMTMWDDHAFYLAVSVADSAGEGTGSSVSAPRPVSTGPSALDASSAAPAEIQFSLVPFNGPGKLSVSLLHSTVFLMDVDRTGERLYRAVENRRVGEVIPSARVAARRYGGRVIYEVAIPWSELAGAAPRTGTQLGFAMRVNDVRGRARPGLEWVGALPGSEVSLLPALILRKP